MDLDELAAVMEDGGLFHLRGGAWHVDAGTDAEGAGGEGDALGVIARGGGDDAAFVNVRRKQGHAIAGSAPLIGFHCGEILAFHPDFGSRTLQIESFQRGGRAETIDAFPGKQDFLAKAAVEWKILNFHGGVF